MYGRDNILVNIRRVMPSLKPALRRIAAYILEEPNKMKLQKIHEVAKECRVSGSTVTRFIRAINFASFHDFKIALAGMSSNELEDMEKTENEVYDDITKSETIGSIIHKIGLRNIEALQETLKIVSPSEIEKAVSAVERANILVFYCVGSSTIAAEHAKLRFYRVGKQSVIYNDPAQQAISASLFDKNNLAIGISNSGRTVPTVSSLKMAKESGATTICITNYDTSPIVKYSDIKLFVSSEVSTFFNESMVSRMCQLLIIDILYASFAAKHFDESIQLIKKAVEDYKRKKTSFF
jgi:DNA-binding MurR/RpiR family transcriptional regulator